MWSDFLSRIWQLAPRSFRRFSVRLVHTRFTATAGAIVLDVDDRVLLLKHRYRSGSGWGIPGGFMERREQPVEALQRELREEVGLEISDVKIVHVRSFPHLKQVEMIFICRAAGKAEPKSGEVIEAEWFSLENLPTGLPQDQQKLIRSVLSDRPKS
jgi:ADP-ribose pyrophosphatase YjhB (NUDIX family)